MGNTPLTNETPTGANETHTGASGPSLMARVAAGLHYDFCPWANRWVYWLKNPLWSLVLATATALGCGIFVNTSVFILAGALAGVLMLGIAWPWLSLRGIRAELSFEHPRGREGSPVKATLKVHNRFPWPALGLVLERGLTRAAGDAAHLALARVSGWTSCAFTWDFVPAVRGVYPTEPPELSSRFPFGLFRAAVRVSVARELIVWPRTVPLESLPDAAEIDPRDDRYSDRHVGDAGDVVGTRGYRQGDSLRRVHWAQSARHQRLIVCEREASAACALSLAVDLAGPSYSHCGEGPASLEQVIRIAASLGESLQRLHADVDCEVGRETFHLGGSFRDLRAFMDFLARVPRSGLPQELAGRTTRRRLRSRVVIALTTDVGLARMSGGHAGPYEHWIVVHGEGYSSSIPAADGHRRPWIELDATCDLAAELPRRWRRACHVA